MNTLQLLVETMKIKYKFEDQIRITKSYLDCWEKQVILYHSILGDPVIFLRGQLEELEKFHKKDIREAKKCQKARKRSGA
jgi:hypothetical protein